MKKILNRKTLEIIKKSSNAFIGLSYNNQPYIRCISYNFDFDMSYYQLIFMVNKDDELYNIVRKNAKVFILIINDCYKIECFGKVYIVDNNLDDIILSIVLDDINGIIENRFFR